LKKGVTFIAVEADWPDAYKINRYVRCIDNVSPEQALSEFKRFPRWMWRNDVVLEFIQWLRKHNESKKDEDRVGFYGMDLYSMFESAHEVIEYLEHTDKVAATRARERYACFDVFGGDASAYGYAASFSFSKSCEKAVIQQLVELQRKYTEEFQKSGFHTENDGIFWARENGLVVKDAEKYYRSMFSENTWNLRDNHMVQTLKDLMKHLGICYPKKTQKAVVWAHNSHLGDASETESRKKRGETNIGELVRKSWGLENTFNIGFSTYTGVVTAADNWDEPPQFKKINPGLDSSYEGLFHKVGIPNFVLLCRTNCPDVKVDEEMKQELSKERLERAIGVIYRPDTERMSHYFSASISRQFDAVIHIDVTDYVRPMDAREELEVEPDTFPTGL